MENKYFINQVQKAQKKQLSNFDISYDGKLASIEISKLVRPTYSTRVIIDNRLKVLKESLKRYGFLGGIFVTLDSYQVIDGWHRLQLWESMGNKIIPCYILNCDEDQERELHLRLNIQLATFNPSDFGLNFEYLNLLEDFGFSEQDLMPTENLIEEKKVAPKKETPIGFKKLSTTIKSDAYDKLIAFKEENKLHHIADAIELLIEQI